MGRGAVHNEESDGEREEEGGVLLGREGGGGGGGNSSGKDVNIWDQVSFFISILILLSQTWKHQRS